MKEIKELFDGLVKEYNLRAITIDNETWYGINDLPVREPRKTFNDLKKQGKENFVKENTKNITNSAVLLEDVRNFDKVNNNGETFGNFKMVNYLVMNSRLGAEYKIELIEILDEIRMKGYYVSDDITKEQLDNLQQEVDRLKGELYGSTEIVKMINVPNLLSSSIFVYLSSIGLGTYNRIKVNRQFRINEEFEERLANKGIARNGKGNEVLFYKEFADKINSCDGAIKELMEINDKELKIQSKGKEKRMPF